MLLKLGLWSLLDDLEKYLNRQRDKNILFEYFVANNSKMSFSTNANQKVKIKKIIKKLGFILGLIKPLLKEISTKY